MSVFRRIIFWMMWVVAGCAAIFLAYLLYRFLLIYWAPTVLSIYILSGAIVTTINIVVSLKIMNSGNADSIFFNIMKSQMNLRTKIHFVFEMITSLTGGWIPVFLFGALKPNHRFTHATHNAALYVPQKNIPPIMLAFISISILISYLYPYNKFWISIFVGVITTNVISRQISYAVSPQSLPTLFRRSVGNAYAAFLLIAVCDVVAMVLSVEYFTNLDQSKIISVDRMQDIVKDIFFGGFTDIVSSLWQNKILSIQSVLLTSLGAIFSLNFLETIYKFKEFRRSDEDTLAIANNYNMINKNADCLSVLGKIKKRDAAFYQIRARANLGVSRIDDAWEDTRKFVSLVDSKHDSKTKNLHTDNNSIFLFLINFLCLTGGSSNVFKNLIRKSLDQNVSDHIILNGLIGSMLPPNEFISETTLNTIEPLIAEDRYPITKSLIFSINGEFDQADKLINRQQSDDTLAMISISHMRLMIRITNPASTVEEDRLFFFEWSDKWLKEFSDINWDHMIASELSVALGTILSINELCNKLAPEDSESWKNILYKVTRNINFDETQQRYLRTIERKLQK